MKESELRCLNCERFIEEDQNFCSNCGQNTKSLKRPFLEILGEFIKSSFNIDNRFFKTIFRILFQPWKIIKDYNIGKRHRYMHPVRLFLFSNLILFSLILFFLNDKDESSPVNINYDQISAASDSIPNNFPGKKIFNLVKNAPVDSLKRWEHLEGDALYAFINQDTTFTKLIQVAGDPSKEKKWQKKFTGFTFKFLIRYQLHGTEGLLASFLSLFSKLNVLFLPIFSFFLWLLFRKSKPYYISYLILMLFLFSHNYLLTSVGMILDKILALNFFTVLSTLWTLIAFILSLHFLFKKKKRSTFFRLFIYCSLAFAITLVGVCYGLFYTMTGEFY